MATILYGSILPDEASQGEFRIDWYFRRRPLKSNENKPSYPTFITYMYTDNIASMKQTLNKLGCIVGQPNMAIQDYSIQRVVTSSDKLNQWISNSSITHIHNSHMQSEIGNVIES